MAHGELGGNPLPADQPVYRAIRSRWVDPASGKLTAAAFLLRAAETGLSVSASYAAATAALRTHKGAARLLVGLIRSLPGPDGSLGLDVVPCPVPADPDHAEIIGVPPWTSEDRESQVLANSVASALLAISIYPVIEE